MQHLHRHAFSCSLEISAHPSILDRKSWARKELSQLWMTLQCCLG